MRQNTGRVLFQESGSPAPFWAANTGVLKEIPRQYQVVELWLRWNPARNSGAGGTEIFASHDILPDGEFQHTTRFHYTTLSGSTAAAPLPILNAQVGKILRVNNNNPTFMKFDSGFVPAGLEGCWIKVMKMAAGDVTITAGTGMTAAFPGGATSYTITQQRKIVTVHITGPASVQANEPNTIYIEE
jgi:hypothetical protein